MKNIHIQYKNWENKNRYNSTQIKSSVRFKCHLTIPNHLTNFYAKYQTKYYNIKSLWIENAKNERNITYILTWMQIVYRWIHVSKVWIK